MNKHLKFIVFTSFMIGCLENTMEFPKIIFTCLLKNVSLDLNMEVQSSNSKLYVFGLKYNYYLAKPQIYVS